MFKCAVTGRNSRPGEKSNRIVVKKRERTYRYEAYQDDDLVEVTSKGWEIVKEITVTDEGLRIYNAMAEAGTQDAFIRTLK